MRRRDVVRLLAGSVAWPCVARAQEAVPPLVGFVRAGSAEEGNYLANAFRQGLSEAGFTDGRSVTVEYRWGSDRYGTLEDIAADLARRGAVLIFAGGAPAAKAVKVATSGIPIVFTSGEDPVASGLIASLSRPGGNITGVTLLVDALGAKRIELLCDLRPKPGRIGLLFNHRNPNSERELKEAQGAATALGRETAVLSASTQAEIETAFAMLVQQGIDVLAVSADSFLLSRRARVVALANESGITAIYAWREFTAGGGLMSYGSSIADAHRQAGVYAGAILKGAKPAQLPVMQPVKFDFTINLRTARTQGIEFPPSLLARADEVIE